MGKIAYIFYRILKNAKELWIYSEKPVEELL